MSQVQKTKSIQNSDKGHRTQKRLLDAGIRLFAKFGYFGASTRQIEAEAKVHRNLIRYHFGNKDDFWKACMNHLFQPLLETALPRFMNVQHQRPEEQLRQLIKLFIHDSAKHPEIHQIFVEEGKRDDWRLKWLVDNYAKQFYSAVVRMYEEARQLSIAPEIGPVGFFYVLTGSSAVFSLAPECRQLTGTDPLTDDMIEVHANNIARLLIRDAPRTGN